MNILYSFLSIRPLASLFTAASGLALFQTANGWNFWVNAALSIVLCIIASVGAVWWKERIEAKKARDDQRKNLSGEFSDSVVDVSKITAEERQAAATRVDQYMTRLENMLATQKGFYDEREKSQASQILMLQTMLDSDTALRKSQEQVISALNQNIVQLRTELESVNEQLTMAISNAKGSSDG